MRNIKKRPAKVDAALKSRAHTPGPWKARNQCVLTDTEFAVTGKPFTIRRVCDCTNVVYIPAREATANAKLIAAAPALLSACDEASFMLRQMAPAIKPGGYHVVEGTIARIEAAILLATGRA